MCVQVAIIKLFESCSQKQNGCYLRSERLLHQQIRKCRFFPTAIPRAGGPTTYYIPNARDQAVPMRQVNVKE